jgi:ABC-type glycerol-3-phosphate transport system substrate-binding protein
MAHSPSTSVKAIAAVAAAATLGIGLAGCGNNNSAVDANGKPVVTVLVVKNSNQAKMSKMGWTRQLAKDTGVDIKWHEVSDQAWGQQKNASLAAGEIDDLNIRAFNPDDASRNPSAFEELGKDLNKMPNVKAFFKEQPIAKKFVTVNGKVRVLPSSRYKGFMASGQHFMINKVWLNKLGLKAPTTWDELIQVAKAFKTRDPNGDGKADEIPINLRALDTDKIGDWWAASLFMNSTGIVTHYNSGPSQQGIYVKDGKVGNFMETPQFRQVVEFLYKLRQEGLVPSDWITAGGDKYNERNQGDGKTPTVGMSFGWDDSAYGSYGSPVANQYEAIPIPSAPGVPASKTVWDGSREANRYEDYHMSMSANAKNKDACFKVINALYSEKYSIQQEYGTLGKDVIKTGPHSYKVTEEFHKRQDAGAQIPALEDRLAGWIPNAVTVSGDRGADHVAAFDKPFAQQYKNYDHTKDMMPIYVRLNEADQNTVANNNTAIFNYAMPAIGRFMSKGGADDDAKWNQFETNLKRYKIDDNVKLWQQAYDKYVK